MGNGNAKANEIIYGTRASLEDVILSLLSNPTEVSFVTNSKLFKTLGWSFPERVPRIYDSASSWKALNFTPKWDFNRLSVEYFNGDCTQVIQDGLY